jgi:hypothetical protein
MEDITQKPDPYDSIVNRKWTPSCGEVHLDPFPAGSKVSVITRGVYITDKQGCVITNSPEETQGICNSLNHMWEIIVIPEMNKRRQSGLPIPSPLESLTVIFDPKTGDKIFNCNEECGLKALVRVRPHISIEAGQDVYFDQICDIDKVKPPSLDNRPVAFIMYKQRGRQISLYFDFRPNNPSFCEDDWKDEELWLADALLETLLAANFGHLSLLIPQLIAYDIPFTIGPRSDNIIKLFEIVNRAKNSEDLDKKLSTFMNIEDVNPLINNWITLNAFQKRKELLLEAFKCFKCGIHSGTIAVLMSQVEGIITEELISKQKGLKQDGTAKPWGTRIDEFNDIVKSENIGPLTLRILNGLVIFLKDSNLYKGFSWTGESTGINRHASLHGKDISFNTRANSVRMILLFDALYWVFLALQTSRSEDDIKDGY